MSDLPPVLWLQAFEAAARTLSFTEAGRELGVTQSAISQRIRLLEDRLGQPLFVRYPRSLALMPAGRAWLPSVQEAFSRLAEGTSEVFGPSPDAPVTLRATPAMQQTWLAPRLMRFQQAHPEITLRLVSAIWADDFGAEGADLEIRYGTGEWGDVAAECLGEERLLPVCSAAVARTLQSPRDLAGQTLLHAAGFAAGWPRWLAEAGMAGLERDCPAMICDTHVTTLALASYGGGVALSHRRLLEASRDLVAPFELDMATEEAFWLVRPASRQPRPPAQALWNWLLDTV
ncbi:LysR substrate-binding domain-containing protein [Salinicola avicenniae]|uniref:LysR substrate-binding domain-containing protein n=1 Tax=Salinicola avicenniae TaxID=2916836 RepID=UPI002072E4A2|nr:MULTISPECIES: LysR substrate-binding domain-containing protein [unclassified Salinicola]